MEKKIKEFKDMEPDWTYKPETVEYYKQALKHIGLMGIDYDGYDTKDAKQMKKLVDDIMRNVDNALEGQPLFYKPKNKEERK